MANGKATWADIAEVSHLLGEVTKDLDPANFSDSDKLAEAAGMDNTGFGDYAVEYGRKTIREVQDVFAMSDNPQEGVLMLVSLVAAAHVSGVMAGAAATREAIENGSKSDGGS